MGTSIMKRLVVLLLLLVPPGALAQDYEVKKVCVGINYAIVVEANDQYYVAKTSRVWRSNWRIISLLGAGMGGTREMEYMDDTGRRKYMQVYVLSRFRWGYSGLPGAKSACRTVANRRF